jgi:Fe-S-cluster-containing dehydrogenase component
MSRDERTGAVLVREKRCIGCMLCRDACPWDVPKRHPERRLALKCDLCVDRAEGPLCVEMCPLSGKALRYEDVSL